MEEMGRLIPFLSIGEMEKHGTNHRKKWKQQRKVYKKNEYISKYKYIDIDMKWKTKKSPKHNCDWGEKERERENEKKQKREETHPHTKKTKRVTSPRY